MAGSFSRNALARRMRNLGNKNKIPSAHPQGNKPSFAGGGPTGRASSGQMASGSHKNPFQRGAPPATGQRPSDPVNKAKANAPTPNSGIMNDMMLDKQRLKTPNPMATAASRKLGF